MNYQQLTEGRQYQNSALLEQGISISEIAKTVKCHRSTLYRELRRCGTKEQYSPDTAQQLSRAKRLNASKYRVPQQRVEFIEFLITEKTGIQSKYLTFLLVLEKKKSVMNGFTVLLPAINGKAVNCFVIYAKVINAIEEAR